MNNEDNLSRARYAVLGPHDFVTVLDAPDNECVAIIYVNLFSRGTTKLTPEII